MKKFGLFSQREEKDGSAEAERLVWRAHEDQPLNLAAPQRGDTMDGQRALVLCFAAVAVAGAAYFGTVMLTHQADSGVSLFSKADAAPEPANAAPEPAVTAPAPTTATNSVVQPVPTTESQPTVAKANPEPKPAETKVAATATANANALVPVPVKVTTIVIPAKPAAARSATASAQTETREQANARWARLAAEAQPIVTDPNAYTEETKRMVSEGVQAILRQVTSEKTSERPVVVASTGSVEQTEREADLEMAGSAAMGGRQARIRTAVNMRSGPGDGSRTIGVIPTNSTVSLAPGCRHWCKVTYQGRTGYIYKRFLR
ncbi:MAG: SH3 domain-containing protein [Rhizobiaceae bacterium]